MFDRSLPRFIFSIIFVLSLCPSVFAQQNCLELFSVIQAQPQTLTLSGPELDNLELPILMDYEITMQQVRDFSGPSGSLALLLKLHFRHEPLGVMSFVQNMYYATMGDTAYSIKHTGDLISILSVQQTNVFKGAKKGEWPAKKILYSTMNAMQTLMRVVFNDPNLNLLTAEGLLKVYGAKNANDLVVKIAEIEARRQSGLNNVKNEDPFEQAFNVMARAIDSALITTAVGPVGIASTLRLDVYVEQVQSLIEKLHLPKDRTEYYTKLSQVADSTVNFNSSTMKVNKTARQLERISIFVHAFVERFPNEASASPSLRMTSPWFLNAVRTTEMFQRIYEITEHRLDDNLEAAQSLNEQVALLMSDADSALGTEARLKLPDENLKNKILQVHSAAQALRVNDLTTEDLSPRFNEIHMLQYQLSEILEKLVSNVETETIQEYSELNFNWSRVVEGKSYDINGRDYDHVVFEKNVISYLKRETMWGDRLLAALHKGYVGTHNQTGLRAVTEIHKDLRYIKIMSRKLRLIGKLKDRTIYFFEVYDKDENFDQVWLRNLIDHH